MGQPSAELQESASAIRVAKKSFADLLKGKSVTGDVNIKKPTTYCNKPAVVFTEEEEEILAKPFSFALVGKFSKGLPVFKDIHPALVKLGLKGAFTVGALKPGYVVINPSLEEDFARLWVRQEWFVAGKPMRLFKWSPNFTYSKESAVAPVWINLPDLPLHLFSKGALYSIASLIGNPVKIDEATANRTRPSIARVCVEIDLLKSSIPQVVIRSGQNIFEQKVFYEDRPVYCSLCSHRGHLPESCFSNGTNQPPNKTHLPINITHSTHEPSVQKKQTKNHKLQNSNLNTQAKEPGVPCKENQNTHTEIILHNKNQITSSKTQNPPAKNRNIQTKIRDFFPKTTTANPKKQSEKSKKQNPDPGHHSQPTEITKISGQLLPQKSRLENQSLSPTKFIPSSFEVGQSSGSAKTAEKVMETSLVPVTQSNRFTALELCDNSDPNLLNLAENGQMSLQTSAAVENFEFFSERIENPLLSLLPFSPTQKKDIHLHTHPSGAIHTPTSLISLGPKDIGPVFCSPSLIDLKNHSSPFKHCANPCSPIKSPPDYPLTPQPVLPLLACKTNENLIAHSTLSLPPSPKIPHSCNDPITQCSENIQVSHSDPIFEFHPITKLPPGQKKKNRKPSSATANPSSSQTPIENVSKDQEKILRILNQQSQLSSGELDFNEIKNSSNVARRNSFEEPSTNSAFSKNRTDYEEVESKSKARKDGKASRPLPTRNALPKLSGSSKFLYKSKPSGSSKSRSK